MLPTPPFPTTHLPRPTTDLYTPPSQVSPLSPLSRPKVVWRNEWVELSMNFVINDTIYHKL